MAIGPNNPLVNPNQTLSGQSLIDAANAIANAQTTGPITELAAQIARNNQQGAGAQKLTGGYFNQLGNFAKGATAQEGQIGSGLNNTLSGIANDTQSVLRSVGQNETGQMAQYAPRGEGGLSNPGLQSLTQEIARQQGLAAQNSGAYRSFGATQGANYQGLAASNQGTFALRGQERLGDIAKATRLSNEPLNAKIAGLRASKGALLAKAMGQLRQQEITNAFTSKGLNLKGQAIAASLSNNAANNATKTSIANANRSAANNRHANPVKAPGSGGGGSGGNNAAFNKSVGQAVGFINGFRGNGKWTTNTYNQLQAKFGTQVVAQALKQLGIGAPTPASSFPQLPIF